MKDLEGKRLNELEARATFQEDTIEKLSKELSIQQKEIILLKEEINSKMLPKQTHEDIKSPVNVKSLKSFHINALADKTAEIKIRATIFLIFPIFLPDQRISLAIGSMKAKIITNGVSETS